MQFKVSYGKGSWDYALLDSKDAELDAVEDDDDRAIALASYIVRECMLDNEDGNGDYSFTMNDVIVVEIYGEITTSSGDTVDPPLPENHGTFDALVEQCETLIKLHDLVEECHDVDRLMATINHQGWDSFDFDDTKYWDDCVRSQHDEDDYEEFAKEEMEICEDGLPDHLHAYFDFEQYGRDLIDDDYYMEVFNGTMYVFNRN